MFLTMSEVFVPTMMDGLNFLEDPGDSDEFDATNIFLILGNYIFIATDSRLTFMDMVTISYALCLIWFLLNNLFRERVLLQDS